MVQNKISEQFALLEALIAEGRVDRVKKIYPNLEKEIDYLAKNDPSGNNKYLGKAVRWLAKEDDVNLESLADSIRRFHDNIQRFDKDKRDINVYKTFADFFAAVNAVAGTLSKTKQKKMVKLEGARQIDAGENYTIVRPETVEASIEYGKGTRWCIAYTDHDDNYFPQYNNDGMAFYILNTKNAPEEYADEYSKLAFVVRSSDGILDSVFDQPDNNVKRDIEQIVIEHLGYSKEWFDDMLKMIGEDAVENPPEHIEKEIERWDEEELFRQVDELNAELSVLLVSLRTPDDYDGDYSIYEYDLSLNFEFEWDVERFKVDFNAVRSAIVTAKYTYGYGDRSREVNKYSDYKIDDCKKNSARCVGILIGDLLGKNIGWSLNDFSYEFELNAEDGTMQSMAYSEPQHLEGESDFENYYADQIREEDQEVHEYLRGGKFLNDLIDADILVPKGPTAADNIIDGYKNIKVERGANFHVAMPYRFNIPIAGEDDETAHMVLGSVKKYFDEYFKDQIRIDAEAYVSKYARANPKLLHEQDGIMSTMKYIGTDVSPYRTSSHNASGRTNRIEAYVELTLSIHESPSKLRMLLRALDTVIYRRAFDYVMSALESEYKFGKEQGRMGMKEEIGKFKYDELREMVEQAMDEMSAMGAGAMEFGAAAGKREDEGEEVDG